MVTRRQLVLGGCALASGLAAGAATLSFSRDMARARQRLAAVPVEVIATRHGALQFAEAGSGPPLLMLHGTGGGFDQGLLFAGRFVAMGYRVIAPSRFGYLGTPMPSGAGPATEAEAMADLLDHLGLAQVAVAGGSAGAIPALAFASRFPDRCRALIPIVPALHLPGQPPVEPWSPFQERLLMAALRSDWLFWSAIRLAPGRVIGSVLATDPDLVAAARPEERHRVQAILDGLLPVSDRADGMLYDNLQTNRPQDIDLAAIAAPTLIVSSEDDRYLTARNARALAQRIPHADTLIFPEGGHVWVGHDAEMWRAVARLIERTG